ncbi:hypothetical protein BVI1335_1520026 [Burkholderia vietnamiensis]|nr:hypothetical protein BVI1335_1520026 [Burkholderia vietnamiensis]
MCPVIPLMRGGDRQTEEVGSGKSLARYFIDVRQIPNDRVEARHVRPLQLNVDSRPHPGKQALKSHPSPFDERCIVAHAPKSLIIGYVHACSRHERLFSHYAAREPHLASHALEGALAKSSHIPTPHCCISATRASTNRTWLSAFAAGAFTSFPISSICGHC